MGSSSSSSMEEGMAGMVGIRNSKGMEAGMVRSSKGMVGIRLSTIRSRVWGWRALVLLD